MTILTLPPVLALWLKNHLEVLPLNGPLSRSRVRFNRLIGEKIQIFEDAVAAYRTNQGGRLTPAEGSEWFREIVGAHPINVEINKDTIETIGNVIIILMGKAFPNLISREAEMHHDVIDIITIALEDSVKEGSNNGNS